MKPDAPIVAPSWDARLTGAAATVSTHTGQGEDKARAYWELGRLLHEALGARAAYGEHNMEAWATRLKLLPRTLYRARRFYQRLPNMTTWSGLSWSHCRVLVTVDDDELLQRLLDETRAGRWSVRQLQAQARLRQTRTHLVPRRGRPSTYRLLPKPEPRLDLGFGLQFRAEQLAPFTDRARRLLDSVDASVVVELAMTAEGTDLRPVWGVAHQRLYTYAVTDPEAVSGNELAGQVHLGPGVSQWMRLVLRGVLPGDGSSNPQLDRLAAALADRQLVIAVDAVGPPPVVDLLASADLSATSQQVAAKGEYVNAQMTQGKEAQAPG